MAIYNRYSKGAVPQDPLKRRRPLPGDYPYEPEVLEAPEELPELPVREFQAPAIPLTPGLNRPQGSGTLTPAPFRTLGQFGQWYTGQPTDILPGDVLPPSPEWGKRTPSYSRLNPPPPRMGASLPGQRPGVIARQPGTGLPPTTAGLMAGLPRFTPQELAVAEVQPRFFDVARQQLAQARQARRNRSQMGASLLGVKPGVIGNQPVETPSPIAPVPLGQQQQFTLPETMRRQAIAAQRGVTPSGQARQFLTESGLQGAIDYRPGTDTWGDIGKELKAGALNFVSSLLPTQAEREQNERMMSLGGRPSVALKPLVTQEGLDRQSEALLASRSSAALGRQAAMEQAKQAAGGSFTQEIANYFAAIAEDPRRAEQSVVTNLPQLLPTVGLAALSKIAALAKTTKAMQLSQALARGTTTLGAVSTAADAQKSAYDNIRQSLIAQGIPEKDANLQAMQKSMPAALIGAGLGAIGARTGLEETILKGGAKGLAQRSLRIGKEFGTEVAEEALPLMATNYQMGQPILKDVGSTIAETLVATSPFAGLAGGAAVEGAGALFRGAGRAVRNILTRPDGGAEKVPDVVQDEVEPAQAGAIPPDRAQAYRDLRERQRATGVSPFGGQRPTGEETSEGIPEEVSKGTLENTTEEGRQLASMRERFEKARAGFQSATQQLLSDKVGEQYEFELAVRIQQEIQRRQQVVEEAQRAGKPVPHFPPLTGREEGLKVQSESEEQLVTGSRPGGFGRIAESMNKARNAALGKLTDAAGVSGRNLENVYEPVMGVIATDMANITKTPTTIRDIEQAAADFDQEGNIWQRWFQEVGKKKYKLTEKDFEILTDVAFGKGRNAVFFNAALQDYLGVDPNSPRANKDAMDVIRQQFASLLNLPTDEPGYQRVSLTTITPAMWRMWAIVNGLDLERDFPGLFENIEQAISREERRSAPSRNRAQDPSRANRDKEYRPTNEEPPTSAGAPPSGQPPSPSPVAPTVPTAPPAPQRPVAPTTAPTTRATSFAPSAPESVAPTEAPSSAKPSPSVPTSSTPPSAPVVSPPQGRTATYNGKKITLTADEAEELAAVEQTYRDDLERVNKMSANTVAERALKSQKKAQAEADFQLERDDILREAHDRQQATPAVKGRPVRPGTPPVAPPAPSGAAQPTQPVAPPTRKAAAQPSQPATPTAKTSLRKRMLDAGWEQDNPQRFTGPDGSTIEREDGSRGKKQGWVHTDATGNRTNYNTAQEAIESVLAEPKVEAAPKPKAAKAAREVTPATPPPPAPRQRKAKAAKEAPSAPSAPPAAPTLIPTAKAEPSGEGQPEGKAQPKVGRAKAAPEAKPTPPQVAAATQRKTKEKPLPESQTAIRRGQIGDKFEAGEIVQTASGRNTTPFPKIAVDTDRKAIATSKRVDAWLRDNAIAEAKARGDKFNEQSFSGSIPSRLTQGDKDAMEEYLFGEQPVVPPPFLKPLTSSTPVAPTPTEAATAPKVEPVADENKALFNEVDAATKPKDRKRIEADYGPKGKKAIFIENNINEILKEAEETGKVTKQCP